MYTQIQVTYIMGDAVSTYFTLTRRYIMIPKRSCSALDVGYRLIFNRKLILQFTSNFERTVEWVLVASQVQYPLGVQLEKVTFYR